MESFEKLRRRNQDFMLIETIKQIGVSNYSLLARMVGMNPETVRYKVNNQLARYGLGVQVNLNYTELGMATGLLVLKAEPPDKQPWRERVSYLSFVGKVMGAEQYVCTYAVPFRFKKKFLDVLAAIKQEGILEDFEAVEAGWLRYPSFRPEFYNFDERRWAVDWRRVDMTLEEVGASCTDVNRDADIDYVDLRILRSMQQSPTVSLAKIAKEMDANERTLRYHNAEHVVKKKLILNSNVRWRKPEIDGKQAELMQAVVSFKDLKREEITPIRKLLNRIPFTWLEAGSEEGGYYAFLDIPIERFHETIDYIESHADTVKDHLSIAILDAAKSHSLLLPDAMFDPKRGWTLPNYLKEMAEIPQEKAA
jgi:DNA-binding Lrp family transcriptional regulator